jgi:hypothetical protein
MNEVGGAVGDAGAKFEKFGLIPLEKFTFF